MEKREEKVNKAKMAIAKMVKEINLERRAEQFGIALSLMIDADRKEPIQLELPL